MNDLELRLYMARDKALQLWGTPCTVGITFTPDKQQWTALTYSSLVDGTFNTNAWLLVDHNTPTLAITELLKQLNEWRPST